MENGNAFLGSTAEFKQVVMYKMPVTVLSKFLNAKKFVYLKFRASELASGISMENSKPISKLVALAEEEVFGQKIRGINDSGIPNGAATDFLSNVRFESDGVSTDFVYSGEEMECGIYFYQSRGITMEASGVLRKGTRLTVQDAFNAYPNEEFVLAFALPKGERISICPEAKDGIKGAGAVYAYAAVGGTIYKEELSAYADTANEVLRLFQG